MATLGSNLPEELRQLLATEGILGPCIKLESDTPPAIKAFIDKVIKSPLHDIAAPLSDFSWEYNKGNFHHWRPLFYHFKKYFETYISSRKDLLLSDDILDTGDAFPKHAVSQILRVMQTVLENCHNKSSFPGLEELLKHLKLLLASTDPEVLIATLETLSALVKINPSKLHVSGKLIGCGPINSSLLSLAQGWGSKEEGLGLFSSVLANERMQDEGSSLSPYGMGNECDELQYRLGSTLHFEFHGLNPQRSEGCSTMTESSGLCVIHIPDLHSRKEEDLLLLKDCVEQYNVPQEHRFSLLTRIRYARSFRSAITCRLYSRICLLAFIVLVQSNDAHDQIVSFFANEPEYTNELVKIVHSEDAVPGNVKTLAMLALTAQLAAYSSSHERSRILSGSNIISGGGNRMVFLNVLQKAVLSLNTSNDPSTLSFVDALLQFYMLHVISSSSSGSAIRGSGMVPTLLPILQDVDSTHMRLVSLAVKALQKLMDYSNASASLLIDLGGLELMARRLQVEVNRVVSAADPSDNLVVIQEMPRFDDDLLYSRKRLIKALLKALGSATYAPANSSRSQNSHDSLLPGSLSLIFHNVERFGGDIYFSAVTVMSELIHKDPTCFSALHELGLPDSFLSSVAAGIFPSSKAITCVPSGLGAICLNAKGLEAVKENMALRFLVDIFTARKYVLAMNEGVVPLANAVEELLRHVSTLRDTGVDIIIEIIDKLASLGDDLCSGPSEKRNSSNAMETGSVYKENGGHSSPGTATNSTTNEINHERFTQLCIFNVMLLVHRTMENSETCRLFVEKKGIEALMRLLFRPSIAQSSEGMSIAVQSTMVFKGFTQHHSAPLAQAFCSSLRGHLRKALSGFNSASGSFLLAPKSTPDEVIFSSLFIVEFNLFLAASRDNRWLTALLTEFGDGSKDVLEDIAHVQREVFWQIALLEDSKLEVDANSSGSTTDSRGSGVSANETDDQTFNSFRQFVDPLLSQRMSGWSVESEFFDLISLYTDLGRATGGQQRLGSDSFTNVLGSGRQLHLPGSSEATGSSKVEVDKQRSYYKSCCDMMRSLSSQINHLFLELGRVMLLPSRRRDDSLSVSSSSKSVASTFAFIALDHLNFGGDIDPSRSEASASTKCRYLGKVIDLIDGMLLDRPDSCNPIMLNCFYGHGVVKAILTTFEATSQLLFTVNRTPTSPMETDDGNSNQVEKEELNYSWIYGPLASYGGLMDHLVTSAFIISPFTKHLLAQPLTNGDIVLPKDAEAFVKVLQSMVLKAILPIWTHPQFPDFSYEFITTIVSIVRHVYSGVEVKNASNITEGRAIAPPPSETTILTIVEMGFSRLRAEEALRQVGTNSVELAMEWLFSHPEEAQEDDELTRALAMSLGNSGKSSVDDAENQVLPEQEDDEVQLPPIDELLLTCNRLLQVKESLAFPVRDLLVMICSQNDGQYRPKVISFIIDHIKLCSSASDSGSSDVLSALFHVIALVLHEDTITREVALQNGLIMIVSDLLSQWDPNSDGGQQLQVPKWVTTAFLAIDRLLQVDPKLSMKLPEQLKKDDLNHESSVVIEEDKPMKLQSTLGIGRLCMSVPEQKRLVEIACRCIKHQLPSETMHVILQLCATLTRTHAVAASFLEDGGLPSLLSLPTASLFPGFDNIAATIIRHILEDPQTLQQAMEAEIRHSVVATTSRHSNGRLTPRNFLLNLASVISRDPVVFMQAANAVCQIETVGERPYVVLLKDREKERCKEKEKHQSADGKTVTYDVNSTTPAGGNVKVPDSNPKNGKSHRKFPQSFTSVVELLLDFVITFVPSPKEDVLTDGVLAPPTLVKMDIDDHAIKGKGKAIATVPEHCESNNQDPSGTLAKVVFILKLLAEILSTYSSSVHVLLRRDTEVSSCRGLPQRDHTERCSGGIFHHILHKFLPYPGSYKEKKADGDWREKLPTRASQFLVASCIRSTEGRRRVLTDINNVFNEFVDSADGFKPPDCYIHAYIDLLNDILAARSSTGSYISAEASVTFIEVGLVRSTTRTLRVLDLDHVDSPKVVTGLVKVLESVTKEHVRATDAGLRKSENSVKLPDQSQPERAVTGSERLQSSETTLQPAPGSFSAVQTSGSSESVTDEMEHDLNIDGGFAEGTEDDFMHETSEEGGGLGNGMVTVGIRFDIQHNGQNSQEDDDMSEDDGDEVDEEDDDVEEDEDEEDEEDHHDLEEDEVHHMPHPDTDQDDHEMDRDEFDEDVLEEEDEDDEDDEDRLLLRLEEGINGINVFDHIEVLGRENSFQNDPLDVMPVEVFSRRRGRATSIYNLFGGTAESGAPSQHPLLAEPSLVLHPPPSRQPENTDDMALSDRTVESASSRLDTIYRSLRSGRQGHRPNMWADDRQQRGGSNALVIPQGLEELLVSQLSRPTPDKNSEMTEPQANGDGVQEEADTELRVGTPVENNGSTSVATLGPELIIGAGSSDVMPETNEFVQGRDASAMHTQAVDMQYEEHNEAVARDAEVVSQESGGSGATLGESLRSLEVEIGSADGHDDGGERQGSTDRLPLGDLQPGRSRRASVSLGNAPPSSIRDATLQSVSELSESPEQAADQSVPANVQQINRAVDTGSIDPAFLEALPEELRAEVLSARQGQAPQPSNDQPQPSDDIDPEFLAALPPDIRAEVLAQQQAQRLQQSQELEGQPVEMDAVSIIATFPQDLRQEVLLTSSDAIIGNLSPALVAEATMLRERFAHRYHSHTIFGMHPRHHRGFSSRRGEAVGSSLDRNGANMALRRSVGGKLIEAEGAPLLDKEALISMIRLLRLVQPIYKGQFQKLLLNICVHHETRSSLVQILMNMLMLDTRKSGKRDGAAPSYRLYSCQSDVMYSRPQFLDGLPPLVSRRILETLTYLARNHPSVAKLFLQLELPSTPVRVLQESDQARGKALMIIEEDETGKELSQKGDVSIVLLLTLFNLPLYLRSVAHLEQLLNLLEVVIDNAETNSKASTAEGSATEQPMDPESTSDSRIISEAGASSNDVKLSKSDCSEPSSSGGNKDCDIDGVMRSLPQAELRLLCSLLAREGLSDNAYVLIAEVLRKLVAIAPVHCHLFIAELATSAQALSASAIHELHKFEEAEKALLSTSTDGTAILRVLQALSSLVASMHEKEKDPHQEDNNDTLSQVREINAVLEPLWLELSSCISKIESYSDSALNVLPVSRAPTTSTTGANPPLPAGAQNVLPYIESFFVTCEKLDPSQSYVGQDFSAVATSEVEETSTTAGQRRTSVSNTKADEKNVAFVKFSEKHRKLLNAFIRQNPGLLEKSFSLMLKVPRFIEFDNKRSHFRSKIKHDHHHSSVRISVRRAYILEDSYNQLRMRSAQDLKGRLTVQFQGEEGIDAGGLTREWYQLLSRVIFDKGALLFTTVGNESTFQPNPNSVYQTEHLSYFKFVGRVVGKALFDGQLLDVHFTRSFYKHILGVKVTYHDIEAIDPDYFKNLKWMLENDISDILDLTFSMDADEEKLILYERAEVTDYELIPGGRNIRVTEENKHQYVNLVAEHRLTTAIRPQITAFLEGFNELITQDLISIFNDKELELLISGLPDIDLDDMRANTEYSGYSAGSPVIQWFWEVAQSFSKEDKARLLQFVTGTSKVPLEGFSALQGISGSQRFQIHKAYGSADHLPSAHTCFNQLDLPEYPSKQRLEERLLMAIHEANEGFGFG